MPSPFIPQTEGELKSLLDGGLLVEGPQLDLKRELPAPGAKANRSLAVDMAAFAIDGGRIFVGIDEGHGTTPASLTPGPLSGLKERVDQIARSAVDEPLTVRCVEIPSGASPGSGYLVIVVPPSPAAPHMADGSYWGRSDTTNRRLPDAEVVRLHDLRRRRDEDILALLDAEVGRDPWSSTRPAEQAHLFLVARPVTGAPDLLQRTLVVESAWAQWLNRGLLDGPPLGQRFEDDWAPDLGVTASVLSRRASGWALHSPYIDAGRRIPEESLEELVLEMEVGEDGSLRLFCGRASSTFSPLGRRLVLERVIKGLTGRLVETARNVADASGYLGSWDLGIAITHLLGICSHEVVKHHTIYSARPYSADDYRQVRRATFEELTSIPEAVVGDLTGRLFRGLGSEALLAQ